MGFRCIKCHKDFGHDMDELKAHMEKCNGFDIEYMDLEELATEHAKTIVAESMIADAKSAIADIMKNAGGKTHEDVNSDN